MPTQKKRSLFRIFLCIGMVISLLVALSIGNRYFAVKKKFTEDIQYYAKDLLNQVKKKIEEQTTVAQSLATTLAKKLSTQEIKPSELEAVLKKIVEKKPALHGIGVAFLGPFSAEKQLYAPYAVRHNEQVIMKHVEDQYDYSQKNWFLKPIQAGAGWNESYFGQVSDALIAEYAVPFYQKDNPKNVRGIVFVTMTLKEIKNIIDSFKIGKAGYGFIINQQGIVLSYPVKDYVKKQYPIDVVIPALKGFYQEVDKQHAGIKKYEDPLTGLPSWLFYEQLPTTGWFLAISVSEREVLAGYPKLLYGITIEYAKTFSQLLLALIMPLVIFLLLLTLFLLNIDQGAIIKYWYASFIFSLIFIAAIALMWQLQLKTPAPVQDSTSALLVDKNSIDQFLNNFSRSHAITIPENKKILLGLYVNHLSLTGPEQVNLNGYVWQKYPKTEQTPEIFLGDTKVSKPLRQLFSTSRDGSQMATYALNASVLQEFDYTMFPFDHKHILVHLRTTNPAHFVLPDLAAYNVLYPASLPGISDQLSIAGWSLERAFFSFKEFTDLRNSKIASYIGEKNVPQLYYTITLKRNFMDSFIAFVFPLIIALSVLFVALLTTEKGGWNTISLIPTLFFAVVLAHIALRNQLPGQPLFYLEYFYIIAYFSMFAATIILFMMVNKINTWLITYKQGLIPKIVYWPLILGLCFITTAVIFYQHVGS